MPVVPHFANECLDNLGLNKELRWPSYDNKLIEEKNTLIVIQINGKKRFLLQAKKDTDKEEIMKIIKENSNTNKFIKNKVIKKIIFVQNRLINILIDE